MSAGPPISTSTHLYQTKRFTYILPKEGQARFAQLHAQVDDWFEHPDQEMAKTMQQEAVRLLKDVLNWATGKSTVEERLLPGGYVFGMDPDRLGIREELERISQLPKWQRDVLALVEALALYLRATLNIGDQAAELDEGNL